MVVFSSSENVPVGQIKHEALLGAYIPAGQSEQFVEPSRILNVHPGQALHLEDEFVSVYVPIGQSVHSVEFECGLYFPAGHRLQLALPKIGLYSPAGQGIQPARLPTPSPGLYVPEGQGTQVVELVAPTTVLYVPAGQKAHAEMWIAPSLLLYEPAGQGVQTKSLPEPVGLYVPAGHARQLEEFVLGSQFKKFTRAQLSTHTPLQSDLPFAHFVHTFPKSVQVAQPGVSHGSQKYPVVPNRSQPTQFSSTIRYPSPQSLRQLFSLNTYGFLHP